MFLIKLHNEPLFGWDQLIHCSQYTIQTQESMFVIFVSFLTIKRKKSLDLDFVLALDFATV